jgi:hypothetical protein
MFYFLLFKTGHAVHENSVIFILHTVSYMALNGVMILNDELRRKQVFGPRFEPGISRLFLISINHYTVTLCNYSIRGHVS